MAAACHNRAVKRYKSATGVMYLRLLKRRLERYHYHLIVAGECGHETITAVDHQGLSTLVKPLDR